MYWNSIVYYIDNILRNKVFIAILAIISLASCSKDLSFTLLDEERWLHDLTSYELYGRKTGTEGCREASKYIVKELAIMGYSPELQEFTFRDSILMRNIIVEIPGDSDSIVIVGAHYDGAVCSPNHQAANDNASGIVALLSIAKSIKAGHDTILLCFWDGEETTQGTSFNGSSHFVEYFNRVDKIKWYCNIDCCGREGDPIYLYYSYDMENLFSKDSLLQSNSLNIIKKVQDKESSDYVPFKKIGIPFWGWNDYDVLSYIHSSNDSANYISISKIQAISDITSSIING